MVIKLKKQVLTIDQLKSGKITKNNLSDTELCVIDIAQAWVRGDDFFSLKTSGSTGVPKELSLPRSVLEYSARQSLAAIDPEGNFGSALLCINPAYIGGIMVIVRAMIADLDLTVLDPQSNPQIDDLYDLTSLVPLQVQSILDTNPDRLKHFKSVLIGGAPLNAGYQSILRNITECTCYQTYGMTETASHIALKNLTKGETSFKTLGDISIDTDERGCLKINGTVTQRQWIQTNDVVDVIARDKFLWKGRADFVINSGGVKLHPEELEARLQNQIKCPFFLAGVADPRLGEKMILVTEKEMLNLENLDFSSFDRYEIPKEIIRLKQFVYTETGKINRKKTLEKI